MQTIVFSLSRTTNEPCIDRPSISSLLVANVHTVGWQEVNGMYYIKILFIYQDLIQEAFTFTHENEGGQQTHHCFLFVMFTACTVQNN